MRSASRTMRLPVYASMSRNNAPTALGSLMLANERKNVFLKSSNNVVTVVGCPCVFLSCNPFAGNQLKRVFNFSPHGGPVGLSLCARVNALSKELSCFVTPSPRLLQAGVGVSSEGKQLLLPLHLVFETPPYFELPPKATPVYPRLSTSLHERGRS